MSNKKRVKTVVRHQHSFEGGIDEILGRLQRFTDEWTQKHNELAAAFHSYQQGSLHHLGEQHGQIQGLMSAADHIDTNVLALAEVLRHVFRMLEAFGVAIERAGLSPELSQEDQAAIETRAGERFDEFVADGFQRVQAARKAAEEKRKAAQEAAQEAQNKLTEDRAEAARAAEALREAEQPRAVVDTGQGGPGADIPEGAQLFGGQ